MNRNMADGPSGYQPSPRDAVEIVRALRSQQVDAIVGDRGVALVRLREVEEELRHRERELAELNASLEDQVAERTRMLAENAKRLRVLASELVEAEERERKRVAKVLHDGVQQMIAAAAFQVESVGKSSELPPKLAQQMSFVRTVLDDAMEQTRELSHDLAGPDLGKVGFVEGIRQVASEMKRKHGLTVELDVDEDAYSTDTRVQTFVFRTVQELLFNVVKHAGVDSASVSCRLTGKSVVVAVADKGRGFDLSALDTGGAEQLGLAGLRHRSADFGATMTIETEPGDGTVVSLSCPRVTQA